uniref:Uncharacterized protein n=1 Tax=Arundo donax TaxID=35708 RepID=A0A0A9DEL8_ARUDO
MASRPLIRSGAGPLNASASQSRPVLVFSLFWALTTRARRPGASAVTGRRAA